MKRFVKSADTKTPVVNSKLEIDRILKRYGASTIGTSENMGERTVVVDCRVAPAEQCFPMIPSGAAALDMIEYTDTLEVKEVRAS